MNRRWSDLGVQHQHVDGLVSDAHLHASHKMHASALALRYGLRCNDEEVDVSAPQGVVGSRSEQAYLDVGTEESRGLFFDGTDLFWSQSQGVNLGVWTMDHALSRETEDTPPGPERTLYRISDMGERLGKRPSGPIGPYRRS